MKAFPLPEGMAEIIVPARTYAVFQLPDSATSGERGDLRRMVSLPIQIGKASVMGNPDGCSCIDNPSFELYPPNFQEDGLFIYIPIRPSV